MVRMKLTTIQILKLVVCKRKIQISKLQTECVPNEPISGCLDNIQISGASLLVMLLQTSTKFFISYNAVLTRLLGLQKVLQELYTANVGMNTIVLALELR